jgi:BirA family biotin operon repressor/biotin-[acetyl-CoA-carboxylase] ligase
MLEAARLAEEGCASGMIVVAEEQTAGQGRLGRTWYSERGTGLYVSMVLRLQLAAPELPVLTLALGLATAEAIGSECDLRWPNDVLINGRKCAGILVQLSGGAAIAGIGINVNQARFPGELAETATSLRIEWGCEQGRDELLERLIDAVSRYTDLLVSDGKDAVLRRFAAASSYVSGRRVVVEQGNGEITGVTDGLDSSGFLYVRQDDGTRRLVLAGGVRPAE